jgi:hypothetical protein
MIDQSKTIISFLLALLDVIVSWANLQAQTQLRAMVHPKPCVQALVLLRIEMLQIWEKLSMYVHKYVGL